MNKGQSLDLIWYDGYWVFSSMFGLVDNVFVVDVQFIEFQVNRYDD